MAATLPAVDAKAVASFLGIRQKDLPYGGKANANSACRASPLTGHVDDDAFHLLSSLTGVAFSDDCVRHASVKKIGRRMHHSTHGKGPERVPKGCSTRKGGARELILAPASVQKHPPCFEKALDTTDLSFWMYTSIPNDKSNLEEESYSDADSEELERRAANENVPDKFVTSDLEQVDEHTKREEFRARIKESLSFVRMRMEMLQDLSLGEAAKEEGTGGGVDTSFMSSTSVLLKHARKQAGILHTEEQAVRLQDLNQWFLNIGKILGDDALGASPKSSSLHGQQDHLRSSNVVKDLHVDSQVLKPAPTPYPFELLRYLEHDVRDRLANLYQGKTYILSHQADIWANANSGSSAGVNEEMLHATMERLQKMESAYEMLGTTIFESLKEVERMEEEFHVLQSELVTNGCPLLTISHKKRSKKSSQKGNKKSTASESDSMNTSSRSESSSAESSARPPNAQSEGISREKEASTLSDQPLKSKGSNSKRNLEAGGKAESKASPNKKKTGPAQKTDKVKGSKQEGKDDVARPNPLASADVSKPPPASSPSALSSVLDATTANGSSKEERCKSATSSIGPDNMNTKEEREKSASSGIGPDNSNAKEERGKSGSPGIGPDNSNGKEERGKSGSPGIGRDDSNASKEVVVSDAPASSDMPLQEGAKQRILDLTGQVCNERLGSVELSKSSNVAEDFPQAQNRLILPKPSMGAQGGRDVMPSDSASLKSLSKPKRKSRRISSEGSKDESAQTDDVAILSLEDCDVESMRQCEYQAADAKVLLENMKKMHKQLQFWRTKNWADKHTGQGKMMPPPVYKNFIKVDASPDMGILCYYNPRTGVNVMRNMSDLDRSMQQSVMSLVTGPGLQ